MSVEQPGVLRRVGPHPFTAVAVLGFVLGAFDLFSAGSEAARRRLASQRPPVYGEFTPGFSKVGVFALILVVVGVVGALILTRRERLRPFFLLSICFAFLLSFAAAVAIIDGDTKAFTDPLERRRLPDYQQDVHYVHDLGVRGFVSKHPDLVPEFRSAHAKTHPPGPVLFLWLLKGIFPGHVVPRALVLALISALVVVPTWFLAKRLAGERAAMFAALLVAVAPAPVIFTFTSMDAVYATLLGGVAALLVYGLGAGGSRRLAFLAGLAAGAASFMTYAVGFVVIGVALWVLFTRPLRESIPTFVLAGVGALMAVAFLRVAIGFDLLASYRAGVRLLQGYQDAAAQKGSPTRSYSYWIFGNVAVWLTFAGLPIAALGLREMFFKRPAYLLALFAPLALVDLSVYFSAETERIGQFSMPFMAVGAAAMLARWEDSRGQRAPPVFAALIGIAGLQTVLLEALYRTFW